MALPIRRKPPLELDWEIETVDGNVIRLAADAVKASNRPTNASGGSQRGDGFGTASLTLNRRIFRDYPDLNLLDTWRATGRSGDVAYEGRLQSMPRSKGDGPEQISIQLVGWMTYLKGRTIAALIIDRRLSGFVEPSLQRQANILSENRRLVGAMSAGWQYEQGAPAIIFDFSSATTDSTYHETGEAAFYAGGQDIGAFRYSFKPLHSYDLSDASHWQDQASISTDDLLSVHEDGTNHGQNEAPNQEVAEAYTGRKFVVVRATHLEGASGNSLTASHAFLYPRVIGMHGLVAQGSAPEEGYGISDVLQYLLARFYPKIKWAGETNSFPLTQCTWHDAPATGYDAVQQLNNLVMWETNVWEDRTFYFEAADLTKADWIIRTDDPGVTVNFQGESIENFANGISVTYTDFFGHTFTLYPDEHEELRDPNENNAATRQGEALWISETVEWQCLEGEALQWGRAKLAEYNRPKRPGSFTVKGHIRDSAGHWHPYWQPRSSQTLAIGDHPSETEPRLIYDASWDEESETTTITVDGLPQTLTAIAARNTLALQSRSLS